MKFIYQAMLFAFIASTTALPQAMRRDSSTCGSDQQLSCCVTSTKVRRDPKSVIDLLTSGLGLDTITKALGLAPLTKGAVLLDQCSPMNITLADVAGLDLGALDLGDLDPSTLDLSTLDLSTLGLSGLDLLTKKCSNTVACCQSESSADGSVVGLALPCVAISSLI